MDGEDEFRGVPAFLLLMIYYIDFLFVSYEHSGKSKVSF